MKKITLLVVALATAAVTQGQVQPQPQGTVTDTIVTPQIQDRAVNAQVRKPHAERPADAYILKGGRTVQWREGVWYRTDAMLGNGYKIDSLGRVTDARGMAYYLREGESVDAYGNIYEREPMTTQQQPAKLPEDPAKKK